MKRLAALTAVTASSMALFGLVPAAGGNAPAGPTRTLVYRATISATADAADTYQTSTGKVTMTFRVVLRTIPYPKRGRYPAYTMVLLRGVKLLGYKGSVAATTVAGCSVSRPLRRGARGNGFVVARPGDGHFLLQLSFDLSYDHLRPTPPSNCYPSAEASWFQRQTSSERSVAINATDDVTDVRFEKAHYWRKRPSVLGESPYSRLVVGKDFVVELEKRYRVGRDRRAGKVRMVFTRA